MATLHLQVLHAAQVEEEETACPRADAQHVAIEAQRTNPCLKTRLTCLNTCRARSETVTTRTHKIDYGHQKQQRPLSGSLTDYMYQQRTQSKSLADPSNYVLNQDRWDLKKDVLSQYGSDPASAKLYHACWS